MEIDCIDMGDPALGAADLQLLDDNCVNSVRLQFFGMSDGARVMVARVAALASPASGQSIDALRIWAHGGPGFQGVSGGASASGSDFAGISIDNYTEIGLEQLTPLFSLGGRLELRGCSVGSGQAGGAFLLDLAWLLNVPVFGGAIIQSGDWKPPVTCGFPSGALATVAGPMLMNNP